MNIVDILIVAILAFGVLAGMHKGLIASGLSTVGFVAWWLGAQSLYEKIANYALSNHFPFQHRQRCSVIGQQATGPIHQHQAVTALLIINIQQAGKHLRHKQSLHCISVSLLVCRIPCHSQSLLSHLILCYRPSTRFRNRQYLFPGEAAHRSICIQHRHPGQIAQCLLLE